MMFHSALFVLLSSRIRPGTVCTGLKTHCFQCLLGFVITLNLVVIVFKWDIPVVLNIS